MRLSAGFLVAFFAACLLTWGQIVTSSVKGAVVDPSGAVVVATNCVLTNIATGQRSAAVTLTANCHSF
jgi:hypothetical protein